MGIIIVYRLLIILFRLFPEYNRQKHHLFPLVRVSNQTATNSHKYVVIPDAPRPTNRHTGDTADIRYLPR